MLGRAAHDCLSGASLRGGWRLLCDASTNERRETFTHSQVHIDRARWPDVRRCAYGLLTSSVCEDFSFVLAAYESFADLLGGRRV